MTDATAHTGPFDTVLVANRGEIAVRVLRTASAHGYRTVAVHSDADAGAPHVLAADDAVLLGPAPARESYLDIDGVIAAARASGAQAIHPGYGFLSENADFAAACVDAGIVFIGPTPEAIRLMGDKAAAKRRMGEAGVPLLPGYQGEEQSDDRLVTEAAKVGFPLMVKAAAGGGGKGMRLVASADDLPAALAAARREALGAFGSDTLILERALLRPRHVEIQVLADAHGHAIALGERDCSVQRRHQKVVEEAPSPAITPATREAMQRAAVTAATEIGYVGAGTVEFLLDEDGETFAFLEMNTRLQVEHPVTELVTGIDLVEWQLRVARGEHLTIRQDDVELRGHAIEVRLYAEDPANGFLPQTGHIAAYVPPGGPGIRVDDGIAPGTDVTAHYDPMLAKVIAHGADRDEARLSLAEALDRTVLLGVTTNRTFLARILRHDTFAAGGATTAFLDEADLPADGPTSAELAAIAARIHLSRRDAVASRAPGSAGWTNATWLRAHQRLRIGDTEHVVIVEERDGAFEVVVDGATHAVQPSARGLTVDGRAVRPHVHATADPARFLAQLAHADLEVVDVLLAPPSSAAVAGAGVLVAPMHGTVTLVQAEVGARVVPGDAVVAIEAMKMEHVVRADVAGTVTEVATVGAQVADGDVLATIEPDDTED